MIDLGLVNGDVWAAEHVDALEDAINDVEADVARFGAFVTRAAAQSMPSSGGGTLTRFTWTATTFDVGGFITTPADELVVPADGDGLYVITGRFDSAGIANTRVFVGRWDSGVVVDSFVNATSQHPTLTPAVGGLLDLVAGDRIVAAVFNSSGSAYDFTGELRLARVSL